MRQRRVVICGLVEMALDGLADHLPGPSFHLIPSQQRQLPMNLLDLSEVVVNAKAMMSNLQNY
jgi:hypothetical protein